ncbi:hypothetical protein JHK85_023051 [Glycine max]|uniref:Uncharacterized protein n=1 Tax=Glycine max TaxID=3847 RepID=K7K0R9_SOYBN|nr:hypothetical protein JHK85_023051 [Glycine max]
MVDASNSDSGSSLNFPLLLINRNQRLPHVHFHTGKINYISLSCAFIYLQSNIDIQLRIVSILFRSYGFVDNKKIT